MFKKLILVLSLIVCCGAFFCRDFKISGVIKCKDTPALNTTVIVYDRSLGFINHELTRNSTTENGIFEIDYKGTALAELNLYYTVKHSCRVNETSTCFYEDNVKVPVDEYSKKDIGSRIITIDIDLVDFSDATKSKTLSLNRKEKC
uniref:Uncharacterized protein n=1 Tax=Parastrongyloides trichosuri TaxID=131310 RepID=A0A0N4Z5A4_PARTI